MSEGNNGSALLAGNPAGDFAAGNGSETTTNTTTTTTPTETSPATGNWYDKFENEELKGYVQNKGWKDPSELAVGYQNLEKLLGSEKIPMPKGADDADGWNRVYQALGRPNTPDEYGLKTPDGQVTDFSKAASSKFYELGLSAQQASNLTEWWNGQQQAFNEQQQAQLAQNTEAQIGELRKEWGGAFDENVELGRRAAREFGLNQEKLTALEGALGTGELLKFMSQIGRGMTEHNFEGGKSTNSFGMTPAAAQQRISALKADQTWSSKYISGDADARAEMQRLMALAFPE